MCVDRELDQARTCRLCGGGGGEGARATAVPSIIVEIHDRIVSKLSTVAGIKKTYANTEVKKIPCHALKETEHSNKEAKKIANVIFTAEIMTRTK